MDVSYFHDFCAHQVDWVAGLLLCFYVPDSSGHMMNLHTSTQNLIHATGFLCPQGVSYQRRAHGCPLTQNTSLSAASCFLFIAHDTILAHSGLGCASGINATDHYTGFN